MAFVRDRDSCIFCLGADAPATAEEHIIPESLGCPPALVLRDGEVCDSCNNRLSKADAKLIEALGVMRPFGRFRTKKGKWPRAELPNGSIRRDGTRISVEVRQDRACEAGFQDHSVVLGDAGPEINFTVGIRLDGRLSRGAHKIALEYLCLVRGRQAALVSDLDEVRRYALGSRPGFRHVLSCEQQLAKRNVIHGVQAIIDAPGRAPVVLMRLCGLPILVSLSPRPEEILELGRDLNQLAGRPVMRTFDQQGVARLPQ